MRTLFFSGMIIAAIALTSSAMAQKASPPKPAAPASAPVPVPRSEFIATMDTEFRKMDADHNNVLTKREVEDFDRAMLGITINNRRRALFVALDADHNGMLSAQEFTRLELPTPQINAAPLFAQNDLNKDGQVSLVEFRTRKLANFDAMDADKDGVVTPVEMKAAGLIK